MDATPPLLNLADLVKMNNDKNPVDEFIFRDSKYTYVGKGKRDDTKLMYKKGDIQKPMSLAVIIKNGNNNVSTIAAEKKEPAVKPAQRLPVQKSMDDSTDLSRNQMRRKNCFNIVTQPAPEISCTQELGMGAEFISEKVNHIVKRDGVLQGEKSKPGVYCLGFLGKEQTALITGQELPIRAENLIATINSWGNDERQVKMTNYTGKTRVGRIALYHSIDQHPSTVKKEAAEKYSYYLKYIPCTVDNYELTESYILRFLALITPREKGLAVARHHQAGPVQYTTANTIVTCSKMPVCLIYELVVMAALPHRSLFCFSNCTSEHTLKHERIPKEVREKTLARLAKDGTFVPPDAIPTSGPFFMSFPLHLDPLEICNFSLVPSPTPLIEPIPNLELYVSEGLGTPVEVALNNFIQREEFSQEGILALRPTRSPVEMSIDEKANEFGNCSIQHISAALAVHGLALVSISSGKTKGNEARRNYINQDGYLTVRKGSWTALKLINSKWVWFKGAEIEYVADIRKELYALLFDAKNWPTAVFAIRQLQEPDDEEEGDGVDEIDEIDEIDEVVWVMEDAGVQERMDVVSVEVIDVEVDVSQEKMDVVSDAGVQERMDAVSVEVIDVEVDVSQEKMDVVSDAGDVSVPEDAVVSQDAMETTSDEGDWISINKLKRSAPFPEGPLAKRQQIQSTRQTSTQPTIDSIRTLIQPTSQPASKSATLTQPPKFTFRSKPVRGEDSSVGLEPRVKTPVTRIQDIDLMTKSVIVGVVSKISPIVKYQRFGAEKEMFAILVSDLTGNIRITFFDQICQKFKGRLELGDSIIVQNPQIKAEYTPSPSEDPGNLLVYAHKFEINCGITTKMTINKLSLGRVATGKEGRDVDILGVCTEMGETTFNSSAGTIQNTLTLCDGSGTTYRLMQFGHYAITPLPTPPFVLKAEKLRIITMGEEKVLVTTNTSVISGNCREEGVSELLALF